MSNTFKLHIVSFDVPFPPNYGGVIDVYYKCKHLHQLGIEIEFTGEGVQEKGLIKSISGNNAPALKVGDVIVQVDSRYFRPTEVETLLGDPSNAKDKLGWVPEITVQEMCAEMVQEDLKLAKYAENMVYCCLKTPQ